MNELFRTMSYLIPKTITVYQDHYEELRRRKGARFNFSKWIRACIAHELDVEVDFSLEQANDEFLKDAPKITLADGRELTVVDSLRETGHQLTEDEEFILQVETYLAEGYPVPEKTIKRYEEAKERVNHD
jgi:predicted CopG family antitoxin